MVEAEIEAASASGWCAGQDLEGKYVFQCATHCGGTFLISPFTPLTFGTAEQEVEEGQEWVVTSTVMEGCNNSLCL